MRRIFFGKNFLVVFFIAVLSFGLVGCLVPTITTGTLKVTIMDDPEYFYYVYLGTSSSGQYLGTTTGSSIYGANSLISSGIPTGYQYIYVISDDGAYSKISSIYIEANKTNLLEIRVK